MAEKLSINKMAAVGVAVLSAAAGILTTALVITSNATQGSLNRMDSTIRDIDLKVTGNTKTVGELDKTISVFIAEMRARNHPRLGPAMQPLPLPARSANNLDVYK